MGNKKSNMDKIYEETQEELGSNEDSDNLGIETQEVCDAETNTCKNEKTKKNRKVQVWIKEETVEYEEELMQLQIELLRMQNHVKKTGEKFLLIFEGRDAAGKGGTIKRLTEHLNPRGCRVVALEKPSEVERSQWYFQRYVSHLPSAGEIVIFDRSWYNRAMVEPVMGFCSQEEHKRFLSDVANFEEMLVKTGGIKLFKFYFSVSKKEQTRRLKSRETDPLKHFKLSPVDKESQKMWDKYTLAKLQMLMASNRTLTPWTIIRSDNKKKARIGAIKHLLNTTEYSGKDEAKIDLNPSDEIVIDGIKEIELMESAKDFSEMAG